MASISGMAKRRDRSPEASGIFVEPKSSRLCIRSGADAEFAVELEELELEELVQDAAPSNSGGQVQGSHHAQFSDPAYFSSSDRSSSINSFLSELLEDPDLTDNSPSEAPLNLDSGGAAAAAKAEAPPPYAPSSHLGRSFRHHISAVGRIHAPVPVLPVQAQALADLIPGCSCPGGCASNSIQRRSSSVPAFKPAPAPRHSVSESALHQTGCAGGGTGGYWNNWMRDGANTDGGLYRAAAALSSSSSTTVPFPSSAMPPRSASPTLAATTAALSTVSQVRAQIQSFTNAGGTFRVQDQDDSRSSSSSSSGTSLSSSAHRSASALISRVVVPSTAQGEPASDVSGTTVGMSFSKLAQTGAGDDSQPQLMQLLVTCAEAVACRDVRQATELLRALRRATSPHGDATQRVGACFVDGLSIRISSNPADGTFKASGGRSSLAMAITMSRNAAAGAGAPTPQQRQEALRLLCHTCPYIAFAHYTANAAILEAFAGEERLHIVDLGTPDLSLQWPSLFYGLASRAGGRPASLRITAVGAGAGAGAGAARLQQAALEAGIPLQFKAIRESLENVSKHMLDLREGEAVAVNSVLQLHCVVKESRSSLNAVLQSMRKLSPKVLTLVEQDASHNGPFFMGRFAEALQYYSAIFHSLDAVLPRYSTQRVKIEQFHFAEEIRNIVACEGHARVERHERIDQWRRRMSRAGFQPWPLRFVEQTQQWLANYDCAGYTLAEEKGCLILGWNNKPIIAASCWRC